MLLILTDTSQREIVAQLTDPHAELAFATWIVDGALQSQTVPVQDARLSNVLLVPTERVRLLRVGLPIKRKDAQRRAVPYAAETLIAEPPETVHSALGAHIDGDDYLTAIVTRSVMDGWMAVAKAAGASKKLVPDVLLLPVPPENTWSIARLQDDRVLVRADDWTGFATPAGFLEVLWVAAGKPVPNLLMGEVILGGETHAAEEDFARGQAVRQPLLDLRQGTYRLESGQGQRRLKLAAAVAAGAMVLHGVIGGVDLLSLQAVSADREAALMQDFRARFPNVRAGTELLSTINRLQDDRGIIQQDTFLTVLSQTSQGLLGETGVAIRDLRFEASDGRLTLSVETNNISALQDMVAALQTSGLAADLSAANAIPGGAQGQLTIMSAAGTN